MFFFIYYYFYQHFFLCFSFIFRLLFFLFLSIKLFFFSFLSSLFSSIFVEKCRSGHMVPLNELLERYMPNISNTAIHTYLAKTSKRPQKQIFFLNWGKLFSEQALQIDRGVCAKSTDIITHIAIIFHL